MLKKALPIIFVCVLFALIFTGCQETPDTNAVVQKGNLDDEISATASAESKVDMGNKWEYSKDYSNGRKLVVNANMYANTENGAPVASVEEKLFQDGESLETLIKNMYPDYNIYSAPDTLTKAQIEENLIELKKRLAEAKENNSTEGIEFLEKTIAEFEQEYEEASSEDSYLPADYTLKEKDNGSYQTNLLAIKDDSYISIDVVNWTYRKGNLLLIEDTGKTVGETKEEYVFPAKYDDDADFQNEKKIADEFLPKMGIDYMSLNNASILENGYDFYYTRTVNGMPETYISNFFHIQHDNEEVMDLWYAESLLIRVIDGDVAYVKWENPSTLTGIDNDNVETISFEEASNIFEKQIDRLLAPDVSTEEGEEIAAFFPENTTLYINRVELGLTKLLMQDSNSYKLIPTWMFMGYTRGSGAGQNGIGSTGQTCYVTINALDGSIVDRLNLY